MTLRNREDAGILNRKQQIVICGELDVEEAMDRS
jgi:hypothetical protein